MAPDTRLTALALGRFGLGARTGDLAKAGADVRGFLAEDVRQKRVALPQGPDLFSTPEALAALRDEREARQRERARPPQGPGEADRPPSGGDAATPPATDPAARPNAGQPPPLPQRLYRAEAMARLTVAMGAEGGFVERLVWFWANHFAVSVMKGGPVRATAGAFEREVIRPHVLGRFADMLVLAETHPTMLFYLDNQLSIGPNSPAGQRRGRGLNENLAREVLELHTLGVDGGYSQADVTALARMLTGWTIVGAAGRLGRPGTSAFNVNAHEPGEAVLLDKRYGDDGPDQSRAALLDLARHPATARHVATKLGRHFVADVPPPALVARLERAFRDSDGDLAAVAVALLDAPEAWSPEAPKVRSPQEFLVAALRLIGMVPANPNRFLAGLVALGQPLWGPPGPNGFPDTVPQWASPEGVKVRLDIAARIGQEAARADPDALLDACLGPLVSAETRQAVARAESRSQAVALLLMAPEFQRR